MAKTKTAQRRLLLIVLVLFLPVACAAAGDDPDSARVALGKTIAEAHCAVCHAIGEADASPTDINKETAFRLLYKRYPIEMLVEAAKTGSISGHDEMPGFDFTLEEAHALLAYIDSLALDQPGYVTRKSKP
jgi:mono/diheme cytochrome c family protein